MQADCFRISVVKMVLLLFQKSGLYPSLTPHRLIWTLWIQEFQIQRCFIWLKKKKISAIKMATRKNLLGLTGHCFYCASEASVSLTLPLAILFFFLTVSYSTDTFVSVHSVHVRTAWIPHHFPLLQWAGRLRKSRVAHATFPHASRLEKEVSGTSIKLWWETLNLLWRSWKRY